MSAAVRGTSSSTQSALACALGALAVVVLASCSADEDANPALTHCKIDDDCGRGRSCYRGYCFDDGMAPTDASTPTDAAHADGGPSGQDGGGGGSGGDEDAGEPEPPPMEPCVPATAGEDPVEDDCYSGPQGSQVEGNCRAGLKTCIPDENSSQGGFWGPCLNEIVPMEHELCNGTDDDCDGSTDEDMSLASCDTLMLGQCREGRTICDQGAAICAVITTPDIEACNAEDDDCDGRTDEGDVAQASCYGSEPGCADADDDGVYECTGVCKAGVQQCMDGEIQPCSGLVTPAAMEDCEPNDDGIADDDNCDGEIDEDCDCTPGEDRPCYSGPAGTHENAPCQTGTQMCLGTGLWDSTCMGEVVPADETCANEGVDDDCDGMADDVPMRGFACEDPDADGRCATGTFVCVNGALECMTPEPREETCDSTDDDCMGGVDEGFNLQDDELNCGTCGTECTAAEPTCCQGSCANTDSDEMHCGTCGHQCGSGYTCCGGTCVDTRSDLLHCGGCGRTCSGTIGPCCQNSVCKTTLCL